MLIIKLKSYLRHMHDECKDLYEIHMPERLLLSLLKFNAHKWCKCEIEEIHPCFWNNDKLVLKSLTWN